MEPGMRRGGTTTWEIARWIRSTDNLLVLTNDVEIAEILLDSSV